MGAFYSAVSGLFELGFRITGVDLRIDGLEHLPRSGPAIIAANHVGYVDYAFVMLAPPRPRREVAFLARADFFERPLVGAALRGLGQIPVDAHGAAAAAMRAAVEHLERGGIVGLHPEGTINPTFQPSEGPIAGRSGAVRLSQLTGAPIVPTAVWGSQRLLTKWRAPSWPDRGIPVRVHYGAPYVVPPGPPAEATADLMSRIGALVDRAIAEEGAPAGSWWVPASAGGGAPGAEEVRERLAAQERERRERRLRGARRGRGRRRRGRR